MLEKISAINQLSSQPSLNETMLPQSICIGCGMNNPVGFKTRFWRDPQHNRGILGRVIIPEYGSGWPGIVHGGSLFTVLDCMAAWTIFSAQNTDPAVNVTQSASTKYFKPARPGQFLHLVGVLQREGSDTKNPSITFGQIYNEQGQLLAELEASLITLKPAVFKRLTGLTELPSDYQRHFPEQK